MFAARPCRWWVMLEGAQQPQTSMLTQHEITCPSSVSFLPRNFLSAACSDPKGIDDACKRLLKEKACTYHRCESDKWRSSHRGGEVLGSSQSYAAGVTPRLGRRIVDRRLESSRRWHNSFNGRYPPFCIQKIPAAHPLSTLAVVPDVHLKWRGCNGRGASMFPPVFAAFAACHKAREMENYQAAACLGRRGSCPAGEKNPSLPLLHSSRRLDHRGSCLVVRIRAFCFCAKACAGSCTFSR